MPLIAAGLQRAINSSVNAPLPQPTSIQCNAAFGSSQSRNFSPVSRLQTPIIRS